MRSGDGIRAICGALIYTTGFVARELARNRQQTQRVYRAAWLRTPSSLTPDDFPLTTSVIHQLPDVAGEAQLELWLAA